MLPIPGTERHGESQVDVVFDGGWRRLRPRPGPLHRLPGVDVRPARRSGSSGHWRPAWRWRARPSRSTSRSPTSDATLRKLESTTCQVRRRPVVPSTHGSRPQEVDRQDPGGVRRGDRPRQVASQPRAHARSPAGRARRSGRHDRRSRARQARPVAGHGARQGDRRRRPAPERDRRRRAAARSRS